MPYRNISEAFTSLTNRNPDLGTYERGLISVCNRAALTLILLLSLVVLPLTFITSLTLPVLLAFVVFFPLVFILNHLKKYQLARHYLTLLLYALIITLLIYRGIDSGALFLVAPTLLLIMILFQHDRPAMYFHLVAIGIILLCLILYYHVYEPMRPYSQEELTFVFPLNLALSLGLIGVFGRFFYKINEESRQELVDVNETKTRLIAVIGHDLRAPINSLVSLLDLLRHGAISQIEFSKLAERLHQNTQVVQDTLNNLLNWSLTQLEGLKAAPVLVNVRTILESTTQLYLEIVRKKKISLQVEIEGEITCWCDEDQLKLIVRNLLSNAIKFTPVGGIVTLSATKTNELVKISVKDTGTGMSPAQLEKIVKPKIINSLRGTAGESGTGIGLMLVQEMVGLNHGKLSVISEPENGSTFTVTLPWQA